MSYVLGLRCRACGRGYPKQATAICQDCLGPLEVAYDYEGIRRALSRQVIASREASIWRYLELLPIEGQIAVGRHVGFTPLVRADNLAEELGVRQVYIKNDGLCFPSCSFKDRAVAVSLNKAIDFGFDTVGCSSTGNLANSVAAQAAKAGLRSFIFIPADLEPTKITATAVYGANLVLVKGNYDEVNRLSNEIAERFGWGFVNINLRPYYAEGSKTLAYEIAEQLGWRVPDQIVLPMAGGTLLSRTGKAFKELEAVGLVSCDTSCRIFGAQASGSAPISRAVKEGRQHVTPVKPSTIAKSIAIGNPADGYYAVRTIVESGGWAEDVSDEEIIQGIELLARTEGIFTETAGGTTVAVTRKLIEQGRIDPEKILVIAITGNGLKTQEAIVDRLELSQAIAPRLEEFERLFELTTSAA